jgi:hypothetical protein
MTPAQYSRVCAIRALVRAGIQGAAMRKMAISLCLLIQRWKLSATLVRKSHAIEVSAILAKGKSSAVEIGSDAVTRKW